MTDRRSLAVSEVQRVLYERGQGHRFTQDSPILLDVWVAYAEQPGKRVDLLLTPHEESSAGILAQKVRAQLGEVGAAGARIAHNKAYVAASLTFEELITKVLPLTKWWNQYVFDKGRAALAAGNALRPETIHLLEAKEAGLPVSASFSDLLQMVRVVGLIRWAELQADRKVQAEPTIEELVNAVLELVAKVQPLRDAAGPYTLWTISLNRQAEQAVWRSTLAVKADAARQLFNITCKNIRWAVIDSGIDARHPAFRRLDSSTGKIAAEPFRKKKDCEKERENCTRIEHTYDFTRLRRLFDPGDPLYKQIMNGPAKDQFRDISDGLLSGRAIDWQPLRPLLEVSYHEPAGAPKQVHGTHVAGILAGDWRKSTAADPEDAPPSQDLIGVCPDLELYDLRVFDDEGKGDEFSIIAALQFVRYLNAHKDQPVIHGVNLSLSLFHDVRNYACGRTPICEECERLVGSGVTVVAAAGNAGYKEAYQSITITDPGNAEGIITVGATHRYKPHTYGVSYFSSRGPTGDGRLKPDLVAPGEKILSAIPGRLSKTLDGTSMAAPHVSGAAALLMARHLELVGNPVAVKKILCGTATDLHRERSFQGSGMVDVLRALQSV